MDQIVFNDNSGQESPQNNENQMGEEQYQRNQVVPDDNNNSALHFFLYLVNFLTLNLVATGLGTILYQIINKNFPEETVSYFSMLREGAIKFGLATVIISTPIFFALSFFITKCIFEGKINENSKVRKWTTYVILFFAASIIVGDLISLVYNWLGGDIATRFILKTLVVIFIAGTIFGYYLWDMRKKNMVGTRYMGNMLFGASSSLVILVVFITSFFIVDSPSQTRYKKIDSRTISSLQGNVGSIENYYREKNELPSSMEDLKSSDYYYIKQPTDNPIIYSKTGAMSYTLCANFKRSNKNDESEQRNNAYGYGSNIENEWKHDAGKVCFEKEVKNKVQPVIQRQFDAGMMPTEAQMEEPRKKAQRAMLKATMSSMVPRAIICRDGGGEVVSGDGGSVSCLGGKNVNSQSNWESISQCGPNPSDAKWIVRNGKNDNWDLTLNCTNILDCNGPANAICNKDGCKFGGTCQ